jgi:hypothetical protein
MLLMSLVPDVSVTTEGRACRCLAVERADVSAHYQASVKALRTSWPLPDCINVPLLERQIEYYRGAERR